MDLEFICLMILGYSVLGIVILTIFVAFEMLDYYKFEDLERKTSAKNTAISFCKLILVTLLIDIGALMCII